MTNSFIFEAVSLVTMMLTSDPTFSQKCEKSHEFAQKLPDALVGQWLYTGDIEYSVDGVATSPRFIDHPREGLCTATARAESLLTITEKSKLLLGAKGKFSFARHSVQIVTPPPSRSTGYTYSCTPTRADRDPLSYSDGAISLSIVQTETGSGFCDVRIKGTMGRGSDISEYHFRLLDEDTLQRWSDDSEIRVYKRM